MKVLHSRTYLAIFRKPYFHTHYESQCIFSLCGVHLIASVTCDVLCDQTESVSHTRRKVKIKLNSLKVHDLGYWNDFLMKFLTVFLVTRGYTFVEYS